MGAGRILIVDDDDVDRERLQRILVEVDNSYDVVAASSGKEARERLKSSYFDCVFVDCRLGDMDGIELVPEINAHRDLPCPAIMVTGFSDERGAVDAVRSGAVDYLSKSSLRPQLVRNAIESGIRTAHLERDLRDAQARLSYLALFDGLTGLPNRTLFSDRLDHAMSVSRRTRQNLAIMVMDLDFFKEVNDKFGHTAGDTVLVQISARIRQFMRHSDTLARLGGDEFAMLLPGVDSADAAIVVAEKIIAAVSEPIMIGPDLVRVGISIGISMCPVDGPGPEALFDNADAAMYSAKRGVRGYAFHVPLSAAPKERRLIASHILAGIEKGELFLEYQPKVQLWSGKTVGFEAFVRWNSTEFGRLAPSQFVPTAERTSVIQPLTHAVFDLALRQAATWLAEGSQMPVAVNLSARMLEDEDLAKRILAQLARFDVPPQLLTVEITETALMMNPLKARMFLNTLSAVGVRFSIDDFGTGYASLRQLRDLHVAEIKIDQTFISALARGNRDYTIVRSILSLGDGFGIPVVAEGIESTTSLDLLRELGCGYGQGYLIGKPMAAAKIAGWLKSYGKGSKSHAAGARAAALDRQSIQQPIPPN